MSVRLQNLSIQEPGRQADATLPLETGNQKNWRWE
jgi:hypothetical protein